MTEPDRVRSLQAQEVGRKHVSVGPDGARLEHLPDLTPAQRQRRLGSVTVEPPDEIVAGAPVDLGFSYTAGDAGLATGAQLGLAWRLPGDWGEPQFDRPEAVNYTTASASNGAALELAFGHRAGVPPWGHLLSVTVTGSAVPPGGTVTLRCGDTRAGGSGWEAQTSSLPDHQFLFLYRPSETGSWFRVGDPPPLRIVGGAGRDLVLVCPSECRVGETFSFTVRATDLWGNPSRGYRGDPDLSGPGLDVEALERLDWDGEPHDLWRVSARFDRPGLHRIEARAPAARLEAESNPVRCREAAPARALYWGDLHGGQGDLGVGQGSLDRYFAFARKVAGLQFTSHQANDVYVTQADWNHTRTVTERHHRPNRFVTFLGCEWTALKHLGGDHNVFYLNDRPRLQRASRWFEDPDDWPDAPTPPDLYRSLDGVEALINLHVGGFTSDLDHHHPRLEKMIEIQCTHATSRWFVADGLSRGYRLGIVGSSDGVSGRPGACRPGRRQSRNLRNGVTGVYATGLTREALWEAFQARRCYATSGERIVLWVEADGHAMGETFHAEVPPEIRVSATGTAAIERVILRRGAEIVAQKTVAAPDPRHPRRYRLLWRGSRQRGTSRDQILSWNGGLTLSEGRLEAVATIDFYAPIDRLDQPAANTLEWRCATAGNEAGVVLDAEAPERAGFVFSAPQGSFRCSRSDVEAGFGLELPEILDGGVRFERAPDPDGPREVELSLRDPGTPTGEQPYWVEVVQVDGAHAWSSPLFIDFGSDP